MPVRPDLTEQVRSHLLPIVKPGQRICLGLSGGLDSMVLLHMLAKLQPQLGFVLHAIHVHHGLSPKADAWAEFCVRACERLQIPCEVALVTVSPQGEGIEAAARRARYAMYARQPTDFIVLAHHQDDQAETLLLNLLRGTGVRGMSAMPLLRRLSADGPWLLRPLLGQGRDALQAYARLHGLEWVEDESNASVSFARNFLRHEVMPRLAERFPAYRSAMHRAAGHFAECTALLEDLARMDLDAARLQHGLRLSTLRGMSRARAKNLLQYWLAIQGAIPWSQARLEECLDQLLEVRQDNRLAMPLGDGQLRVWRNGLFFVQCMPPQVQQPVTWQGEASLSFAGGQVVFDREIGAGLSLARLVAGLACLRLRQGGERLQPDCRRPRRPLKKWLQEVAIPPWERHRLPVLEVDGVPAWVAGLGVDCAYQAEPGEEGVRLSWMPGGIGEA